MNHCDTCAKSDTCGGGNLNVVFCTQHEPKPMTRYEKMFGTPERAMLTIASWCTHTLNGGCRGCPVYGSDIDDCSDCEALLDWLEGDAE